MVVLGTHLGGGSLFATFTLVMSRVSVHTLNPEYSILQCFPMMLNFVVLVTELSAVPTRRCISDALTMLERMAHRGGCGCEENTGEWFKGWLLLAYMYASSMTYHTGKIFGYWRCTDVGRNPTVPARMSSGCSEL